MLARLCFIYNGPYENIFGTFIDNLLSRCGMFTIIYFYTVPELLCSSVKQGISNTNKCYCQFCIKKGNRSYYYLCMFTSFGEKCPTVHVTLLVIWGCVVFTTDITIICAILTRNKMTGYWIRNLLGVNLCSFWTTNCARPEAFVYYSVDGDFAISGFWPYK